MLRSQEVHATVPKIRDGGFKETIRIPVDLHSTSGVKRA